MINEFAPAKINLSLHLVGQKSEGYHLLDSIVSFVNVGDTVGEGDVLCVIEAMKLFNDIESEVSGKIVKILVDDSSPVEFDQPLFLVDPS